MTPKPSPEDAEILAAMAADADDERTLQLLAATHDEDEWEVVDVVCTVGPPKTRLP